VTRPDTLTLASRALNGKPHLNGRGDGGVLTKVTESPSAGDDEIFHNGAVQIATGGRIRVGLIDCLRFSRDCLIRAFATCHPDLIAIPFSTIKECMQAESHDLDIILYYSHDDSSSEPITLQNVKSLREVFPKVPVVVLSDARSALHPRNIRNALNSGAQGFIPTLTTEVPAALAAIRFVRDGGTFAPLNLLLAGRGEQAAAKTETSPANRLTPRQMVVLAHLKQGKANKIIAYELGMTESTVKVHIRNIMRKLGATNRTQAVYNSQQLNNLPYVGAGTD
jgi:DNA-binding NarL/FixJ family response regulator